MTGDVFKMPFETKMTNAEQSELVAQLVRMSDADVLAMYLREQESGDTMKMILAHREMISRDADDRGKGHRPVR